jgi:hypothetical protein
MPGTGEYSGLRLLENMVLHLLLLATVLEHFRRTLSTSHWPAASQARPDFGGMHVLVELVEVCDVGHVECLSINLGNNLVRGSIAAGMLSRGNLSGDGATERKSVRNKDTSALLELDEPLAVVARPVELVDILSDDIRVHDITLRGDLGVGSSREWNWKKSADDLKPFRT